MGRQLEQLNQPLIDFIEKQKYQIMKLKRDSKKSNVNYDEVKNKEMTIKNLKLEIDHRDIKISRLSKQVDNQVAYIDNLLDKNESLNQQLKDERKQIDELNDIREVMERQKTENEEVRLSWFSDNKFYELTTLAQSTDELLLARIGANDPKFN